MPTFAAPKPKGREETAEEKAAWLAIRNHINELAIIEGQQFDLPGRITVIAGDPNDPDKPIYKPVKNRRTGIETEEPHLKVTVKLDDPRFAALVIVKDVRISFFDGNLRGQSSRSQFRGGFYHIYRAATGQEPPSGIVNGTQAWDPGDWCNIPMRVFFLYEGRVKEGEEYYGTRANLKVWFDHVEPTKETIKRARPADDDGYGDDEPSPFAPTVAPAAAANASSAPQQAALPTTKPKMTERQRKFITVLARETDTDAEELAADLFGIPLDRLDTEQAAGVLTALQYIRQENPIEAAKPVGDELGLPI